MKIILQGTPKRKTKSNITNNVIYCMFHGLPVVLVVVACIMLVVQLLHLNENAYQYMWRLVAAAFVLFMGSSVEKLQCPYCSHFFTLKRMTENEYERSTERRVSNTYDNYDDAMSMDLRGNVYYTQIHTKNRQYGTEVTDHYTYKVKCSCCGCVAKTSTKKTHVNWD